MEDAEYVVVGAGALGLAAGRAVARRGHGVVVLERATVGHAGSGSKGTARIFRLGYDDPVYVRLAMVSLTLWRRLEAESGVPLLTVTGQLTFGDDLGRLTDALDAAGAAYEKLAPIAATERFPAVACAGPVVFEPDSGVIAADACLATLRREPGVEVREATTVVSCHDDGRRVRIVVEGDGRRRSVWASVVVVCAGPATAALVAGAAVWPGTAPTSEQVLYLRPPAAGLGTVPVVVERRRPWFYALPDPGRGLLKISLHGAGPALSLEALADPATAEADDPALVGALMTAARRVLPRCPPEPVAGERCVYDNSPDGGFVLDRIGRLVIGAGTSGHGFKFVPLLGEWMAQLATGEMTGGSLVGYEDRRRFSVDRLASLGTGPPPVHL